ncbi:GGDEF domain-containing protein [Paractinoplanes durhamensis]|uniref:GGDEF domain-containing protein n=1 Tax=Paractinoplanes durhamensis TaxID=113563 RepID=UPI0031E2505D
MTGTLVVSYLAWPASARPWLLLVVALSPMFAVIRGLRRAPAGTRLAWGLLLGAIGAYSLGNAIWVWLIETAGRSTANDNVAVSGATSVGGVLALAASLAVVRQRGRGDVGGIIDSVIAAVGLTGVLWDAALWPALTAAGVSTGPQVINYINVFLAAGTIGALLRVSLVTGRQITSVRLLTAAVGCALLENVSAALTGRSGTDWVYVFYMAAFVAIGCAALHPSMAAITTPGRVPDDHLNNGRLVFLGAMLAIGPVVGGGRVMFGLPTDGILLALSSAGMIPLVMARIARLSNARREAERALHRLATSDPLTGLPNRSACVDRIDRELAAGPDDLAVLFCDLDGFKPVNDRLGHAAGDALLVAVADNLSAGSRGTDLVSRFGGDEFVIICRGPGAAEAMTDRIRAMVAGTFDTGGEQVRIGVSVGLTQAVPGDTTDDILTRADLAMYESKKTKTIGTLSLTAA